MRRGFGAVGVTVVLGLAALTSACTTSTTPPAESSSTVPATSGSTTTSTTPGGSTSSGSASTAFGMPQTALANTPEGAVAFTSYFLAQANAAYASSDSGVYRDLVTPSCKTCSAMTATLDEYKAKKYKYVGDFVTPTNATINSFSGEEISVLVSTDTKPSKVFTETGSLVEEIPGARSNIAVQLQREGESWQVSGIKGA